MIDAGEELMIVIVIRGSAVAIVFPDTGVEMYSSIFRLIGLKSDIGI